MEPFHVKKLLCLGACLVALAGCAAPQQPNADLATLQRVAYVEPGAPALTLITGADYLRKALPYLKESR